jgi:hypothetical protein
MDIAEATYTKRVGLFYLIEYHLRDIRVQDDATLSYSGCNSLTSFRY